MASKCGNDKAHTFHHIETRVVKKCSGKTACNTQMHEAHHYTKIERVWCPGVCLCGSGRGDHGPGEHK